MKKGLSVKRGGGNSVNEGLCEDLDRKGNSVKRSGPFNEPADSENRKVAVLIPFPKSALSQRALRDISMSRGKNCRLETIFDSPLPSPKKNCLLKYLPNCLSPTREGFFLFQNCPRGEGNCETIERQKLSRGNFCPATSRCLFWPTGYSKTSRIFREWTILKRPLFPKGLFSDAESQLQLHMQNHHHMKL